MPAELEVTPSQQRIAGQFARGRFFQELAQALMLLTPRERLMATAVMASALISGALNLGGLTSIYPLIQLVLDPDLLQKEGRLPAALRLVGLSSVDRALLACSALAMILIVVKNFYSLVHARLLNTFCARAVSRAATELLAEIVNAPYAWLTTRNASVLRDTIVLHVDQWGRGILRSTLQLATDSIFIGLSLGFMIVSAPFGGLIVSVACGVLGIAAAGLVRNRIAKSAEIKRQSSRVAGVLATEAISGGRDVRISGAGEFLIGNFKANFERSHDADTQTRVLQAVPRVWMEIIGFGALIGFFVVALWSGSDQAEVAGLLALYAVIAMRAIPVISQVASAFAILFAALPSVAEIRAVQRDLERETSKRRSAETKPLAEDWRTLTLEGVCFSYPASERPAIGPIDLTVARGDSIGIVGPSGAGKSTLVDLLAGLLEPTAGRLALDGEAVVGDRLTAWRRRVAYVAQTPYLIDGTLAENISFGATRDGVHESRLRSAVEAAGLSSFVASLPQGLETPVGDRGIMLSGGQRQRVAIARALFREVDVLILDEATSALDSVTEREVHEAINRLKGTVTLFVIAHRLSTVTDCDSIIVLQDGVIVGHGPHARLLADNPHYRRLVEAQALAGDALSEVAAGGEI